MVVLQVVEPLQRKTHHLLDVSVAGPGAHALLGNRVHLLFGDLEQLLAAVTGRIERRIGDLAADLDQLSQHRLFAHDLGIAGDVGPAGCFVGEHRQVGTTLDPVEQIVAREPVGHGDRIGRLMVVLQLTDGAEDQAMGFTIEVALGELVGNLVPGFRGQHQRPKQALFGLHRVRWLTYGLQRCNVGLGQETPTVSFDLEWGRSAV